MAKMLDGEFYHDECLFEAKRLGDKPLPYDVARNGEQRCAYCSEEITEEDD